MDGPALNPPLFDVPWPGAPTPTGPPGAARALLPSLRTVRVARRRAGGRGPCGDVFGRISSTGACCDQLPPQDATNPPIRPVEPLCSCVGPDLVVPFGGARLVGSDVDASSAFVPSAQIEKGDERRCATTQCPAWHRSWLSRVAPTPIQQLTALGNGVLPLQAVQAVHARSRLTSI